MNYDTTGTDDGPALMLVHGFLSSNDQWLPNIDVLGRSFKLVLVELWGHGRSPVPPDESFSIARYDEEFERIRRELGLAQWGVIGQSYAAGLAIRYAINHPEYTTGVVVTNSRSAFGDITRDARRRPQGDGGRQRPVDTTNNRHIPVHPIYARRLPKDVKEKLVAAADGIPAAAIEKSGLVGMRLNAMKILDQVKVPILLTNGQYEKAFQADAEIIRQKFGNVTVADLPGGHAVNIEAADEFNATVSSFFEGIVSQREG